MKNITLLLLVFFISLNLIAQNNSLDFDGVNDIVIGPSDPILELDEGTVELWLKPESKPTSQTFICYRNSSGSKTKYLWNLIPNLTGIGFWNGTYFTSINYQFTAGTWYHLAFVGSSGATKVYVNGIDIGSFVIPFGSAVGSDLNLILGNDIPGGEFFNGEIDEVRIWNKKLCKEEIMSGINCTLNGNEPGLITYYDFNQGNPGGNNSNESILIDSSPNGFDSNLNNFTLNGTTSNWVNSSNGVGGNCAVVECPPSHTVQTYYLITSDYAYVQDEYDEVIRSMKEIQGWYQAETGGKTFHLTTPDSAIVVNLPNTSAYYNVEYWGRILGDLGNLGYAVWDAGKINVYFIKGGGGVALAAQFCGTDCGVAMIGMDIYPQFNTGQFFTCPNVPGGAAAWPCTPLGAAAHEIGHAFGLPHPIGNPSTAAVANHSLMQTHWNYPYNFAPASESPWGILTEERLTLLSNPFFFDSIQLLQDNEDLPIVNLPNTGVAPTADFTYSVLDKTITLNNTSTNHIYDYWTFGDKNISHESSPIYTFDDYGTYTVRLRVLHANGMMSIKEEVITVSCQFDIDVDFDPQNNTVINVENSITTLGVVDILSTKKVVFSAGYDITLNPGFSSIAGSDFLANIGGCSSSINLSSPLSNSIKPLQTKKKEKIHSEEILVYPNPTDGLINIEGKNINMIELYDHLGRKLISQIGSDPKLDISNLKAGVYLLRFRTLNGISSQKVIKI